MTPTERLTLAIARQNEGRLAEAEALCREVIASDPRNADAFHLLGTIAGRVGKFREAEQLFRAALQQRPNHADALFGLGNIAVAAGRPDAAVRLFQEAIRHHPTVADYHGNLGVALFHLGQLDEAIDAYRRSLLIKPANVHTTTNLGNALVARGTTAEAEEAFRTALKLDPLHLEAFSGLGALLLATGRHEESIATYKEAMALLPESAIAHYNLGVAFSKTGQLDEASAAYERAIALQPVFIEAQSNLAKTLKDRGEIDRAADCYRAALSLDPKNHVVHSGLLYTLLFSAPKPKDRYRDELSRFAEQHTGEVRSALLPSENDRSKERRLRVGYVSPNFCRHVISHFFIPLLEAHDHAQFELFCYANVSSPDYLTARVRNAANHWRECSQISDDDLFRQIRSDGIDILVDLTQHMGNNRLLVFARRAAPIQVAWLGYPRGTGIPAMDYRLTDSFMDPAGAPWAESSEAPIRLPDCWFCFDPLDEYPTFDKLPADTKGYVTFGCLNNFCKINESVVGQWAKVLHATEGSRFLMKCPHGSAQQRVTHQFESLGISPERLEFVSWLRNRDEFLNLFSQMDVALDPFPYNGGTTTCESLWMGVPVVSEIGTSTLSRIGFSILSAAGMTEFVASNSEHFVSLATKIAGDRAKLREWRTTLRQRMAASPFMDARRFARSVEAAYSDLWRRWCGTPAATAAAFGRR